MYGGLGSTAASFGLHDTAQYVAPGVSWQMGRNTLRFSTAVGIGYESSGMLLRVGYSYEIPGLGRGDRK